MTTGESGRGLILKRELSLDECKYILSEIFGIKLYTREDFDDEESQNSSKSKIDYTKNSEVLNSIDTLVTYRDSVLLIFK